MPWSWEPSSCGSRAFPQKLFYVLEGPFLAGSTTPWGQKRVHLSEVASIRLLPYALPFLAPRPNSPDARLLPERSAPPRSPRGLPVEAFVGARRGEGVLLVLKDGTGLLLNPEDPRLLLSWKEAA
jgi:hypothetical protein